MWIWMAARNLKLLTITHDGNSLLSVQIYVQHSVISKFYIFNIKWILLATQRTLNKMQKKKLCSYDLYVLNTPLLDTEFAFENSIQRWRWALSCAKKVVKSYSPIKICGNKQINKYYNKRCKNWIGGSFWGMGFPYFCSIRISNYKISYIYCYTHTTKTIPWEAK